jgi:hypothetical protein
MSLALNRTLAFVVGLGLAAPLPAVSDADCKVISGAQCPPDPPTSVSPVGTSLEVENYRCTVTSERSIECQNIGRVCRAALAKYKEHSDYYFRCALNEWRTSHPGKECPPVDSEENKAVLQCLPTDFQ